MTVTPKVDPRKDRGRRNAGPSTFTAYAVWALVAVSAIGTAASVFVWREGKAPLAQAPAAPPPVQQVVVNPTSEREISRLHDAVRVLAAERDRLANRLEQLERSVGDITASIPPKRQAVPDVEPPPPSAPPVQVVAPATAPAPAPNPQPRPQNGPAPNQIMPLQQPAQSPAAPSPAPEQTGAIPTPETTGATRTEFALDLGGEKTVDGLRARWATLRGNHGAALEGLRPLVNVKEGTKAGTVELRLVAGPLANAAAAARVCARLQTGGVPCVPTVFDGQRLSLR